MQGHGDSKNRRFVHDLVTLQHPYLRILLSVTGTFDLEAWSRYVTQPYVEGMVPWRRVCLKPNPSSGLARGCILRIFRHLYGLWDVGDAWW